MPTSPASPTEIPAGTDYLQTLVVALPDADAADGAAAASAPPVVSLSFRLPLDDTEDGPCYTVAILLSGPSRPT